VQELMAQRQIDAFVGHQTQALVRMFLTSFPGHMAWENVCHPCQGWQIQMQPPQP